MNSNIGVSIAREDKYNVQELVYEINSGSKNADSLCTFYGTEGFSLDIFADFERLTEKAKNKLIENLAISKSEADAEITNSQNGTHRFYEEYLDGED
jgi:hypothetical protein